MTGPVGFLNALAQALSTMLLYAAGHPARERAIEAAYRALQDFREEVGHDAFTFTFLGDEVLFGNRPLRELRSWPWAARLAELGIQRVQFKGPVEPEDFSGFLDAVFDRLAATGPDTAEMRPARPTAIEFGAVGLREKETPAEKPVTGLWLTLRDEAEAVAWIHDEVGRGGGLPVVEAEAVIRSLAVAMQAEERILLPLLQLRSYDEYTVTHSLNVAVLAMALAEREGLAAGEVRAIGIAGLLHDIGKIRVPRDVLLKPGRLTPAERAAINSHPVEGARIILSNPGPLETAATVAYEHHILLNGSGYPRLFFPRDCHFASKLVHVCDVYDALRTNRPYRQAYPAEWILRYIDDRAGVEFDGDLARTFTDLMRRLEDRVVLLTPDDEPPGAPGAPGGPED